jgi:hypothetical protein
MRPAQEPPPHRVELAEVGRDGLAPVQRATRSASARWTFVTAAVFALAALVLAVVGVAAPERGGDLPAGVVKVAGVDPVLAGEVAVDATNPIPITVTGVEGDRGTVALRVFGRPIGREQTVPIPAERRRLATTVRVDPWLLVGHTTAEVTVANGDRHRGTYRFGMTATQPASRTAAAAFVIVVALMAMALMDRTIRDICRGTERAVGRIAVPGCAAVVAAAAVVLAWIVLGREPTVPGLVGCVALAVVAGVTVTFGARRVGRRVR